MDGLVVIPITVAFDDNGALDILTIGTGRSVLLQNGKTTLITQTKKYPRARTILKKGKRTFNW